MIRTAPKKVINGWAMYDWANSVYNLVITTTFFPIYFTAATKHFFKSETIPFLGHNFVNSSLYSYSLAAAYLIISICYPVLTSIADTRGNKKNFMRFFCYMGALGCSSLFFFDGSNLWLGVGGCILASMGWAGSLVFYNAYLPEIAAPEDRGPGQCKRIHLWLYRQCDPADHRLCPCADAYKRSFSWPEAHVFAGGDLVGGIRANDFCGVAGGSSSDTRRTNVFVAGFAEVRKVFKEIRKLAVLKRYLRAFFFYSMGVQTVMMAATLFGSKLLGLDDTKLIVTVVLIQLVAIVGAMWMSKLSARYGNIRVLMGVVLIWILICVSAWFTAGQAEHLKFFHDKITELRQQRDDLVAKKATMDAAAYDLADARVEGELSRWENDLAPHQEPIEYSFYALALGVGLVMGGIQSLSRSTYSKLMPETKDTASYFSYYDLTEKIAIVIGMFSFGFIDDMTGSMKNAVLFLICFFVVGLIWLYSALVRQKKLAI
ncbi:MFS transporter [Puia sp. P3]|uniref:MFS transporter n=1 Tax=Puia sp. P3 TaxID=3423952 RepID=UPI003D66C80A